MNSFLFYFIIFSCLAFENFSKCCCDWCDEYCCDWCNETKYNEEYFLNSGYNINVPLKLEWHNCNCAAVAVFRFILSDKDLLKKVTNPDQNSVTDKEKFSKIKELFYNIRSKKGNYNEMMYSIINLNEENFYFDTMDILLYCLNTYFNDIFNMQYTSHFIDKPGGESGIAENFSILDIESNEVTHPFEFKDEKRYKEEFMKKNNLQEEEANKIIKGLTGTTNFIKEEFSTNKYISLYSSNILPGLFEKPTVNGKEYKDFEKISITQKDGSKKDYELIGLIGLCGKIEETNKSEIDTVLLVPVYDKEGNKKGWVKYQFNKVSEVHGLQYWKDVDNFDGWKNPTFRHYIYKCTN